MDKQKVKLEIKDLDQEQISTPSSTKSQEISKEFYATGKRKTSIARVWAKPGKGKFTVNNKSLKDYFIRELYIDHIIKPLSLFDMKDNFDVFCTVKGGGLSGQAGSIFHGLSRTISKISEDFRKTLSSKKFLTRDPRVVERKKYGKHKARKSTQFSKR